MTKTAKATEKTEPILYDASAQQIIPLTLDKNGKDITVSHTIDPLSFEQFFEFEEERERKAETIKELSSAIYDPKDHLWQKLCLSVEGYKPRDDWQKGVPATHRAAAINALVGVQLNENSPTDDESQYFDIDELTVIPFGAMYAGTLLMDLSISFRAETRAETTEFMAIAEGNPNRTVMASAAKMSRSERLYNLGKNMVKESTGYAGEIPPWHLAPATESFFLRQFAQAKGSLGK